MSVELNKDQAFSSAVAGLPKVAELIATCPFKDRQRASEAAEHSYRETARGLGYQEADALEWAEAVMVRLRLALDWLPPKVPERLRAHRTVPDSIGDTDMAEVVLEPSGIHSSVG